MIAAMLRPLAVFQLRAYYDRAPSTMSAASHDAQRLATLGVAMTVVATLIFLLVVGIIGFGLWRRRNSPDALDSPADVRTPVDVSENWWILGGGLAMPVVVLAGVFLMTLSTMRAYRPAPAGAPEILVIGHQWWWEVRYPNDTVITANELHLPVGRAVHLELRSADVIHSFWAPNLEGKTDVIPGQQNEMVLRADSAGVYRAECAEYCGRQHANMALSIVAEAPADYQRWLSSTKAVAAAPANDTARAGLAVFMSHSCAFCHSIRGTPATGSFGPDLTHLGSRSTLAGGALPNTVGYLAGWISNPDRLKPGTKMPASPMDGASLQAVVRYLEGLK
jgi:cytochrome c oxidase subunit 2